MNYLNQLAKTLDPYYAKLPALPKGVNDFIVSVAPWLALIFGVLALLSGLGAFGLLTAFSPVAMYAGVGGYALAAMAAAVVLLLQGVIDLLAFSPLKTRKKKGWDLMFLGVVLGVVSSVVTLSVSSVVGGVIGALIGYYFLYQVRTYYH